MSQAPDAALSTPIVRGAIDFQRFPWIRPLVTAYADRFHTVAPLFAGNPAEPDAWRDTIRRVSGSPRRHRDLVARVVRDQLARREAPARARAAAEALADPGTVAIVTGQQAGLFGGPFYTALKAVTAIQLARRLSATQGVTVVPVFWVDAEDHDWDEIRGVTLLDRDYNVVEAALADLPGARTRPVGTLTFDERVNDTIAALRDLLPPTDCTAATLASAARHYRPGVTVAAAFASWIEELLGNHGLVVFDAGDAAAKPVAADLFVHELSQPGRTGQLVRDAGALMSRLGHHPQVEPAADGVNLFYLDDQGRHPIRERSGSFVIGDDVTRNRADLSAEAADHPERFSPNVILRPLVQDRLFPTICYVAGPSELAYQAQLGGVYKEFGIEPPLLASRSSATVIDSASLRFLERHDLPFETLQGQDESVLNRLLERQLPPEIEQTINTIERQMADHTRDLRTAVGTIDPTLTGAVDTTFDRVRETFRNLQGKIVHASKKKDDTLRRQFVRARGQAFPGGHPQERILGVPYFANRYGLTFADRLVECLPADVSKHYLLTL